MQPIHGLFSSSETDKNLLGDNTTPDKQNIKTSTPANVVNLEGPESEMPNQGFQPLRSSDLTIDVRSARNASVDCVSMPVPFLKSPRTTQQTIERRYKSPPSSRTFNRSIFTLGSTPQRWGNGSISVQTGRPDYNESRNRGRRRTSQACG
ncbi:hypothetical protein CABS01_16833 [Colletotrichum abscissum]|uniref:uncharacterized protein n=1 Tax=Colletotrichum abscissum TaxID=1671311 RepID=UPI0027D5BE59|nr:uncharacterized protein CABS01_16833 [Colletotrichum abscissum]KAK1509316.1 hypothetical protein CABS01_16833 [Colletotrichum abscissum]